MQKTILCRQFHRLPDFLRIRNGKHLFWGHFGDGLKVTVIDVGVDPFVDGIDFGAEIFGVEV
jgi:hypothetical protein